MAESTAALPGVQQKLAAEVIGTFVLVFFGCGSVVYATNTGASSTVTTVGLTFGVAVMVMAYAFGRVSGGHFNPAVSVGAAISGRISWRETGLYVLAQLVGAFLGALVLFLLMHGFDGFDATDNMGQNFFGDQGGSQYAWWAAFLMEALMTAVFVLVILAVTDERFEHPALAPLTIGFTLAAIHFVMIPATGTSVNPARSIGPALFAGSDAILQLWLFILAPLLGAVVAGYGYPALFGRHGDPVPGSGITFPRPRAQTVVVGPDQYQQQWNQESGTASYQAAQPIVQDGWQWDPVGQQWHPVGQTPEQWRAQQAAQEQAQQQASEEPPGDQTQIRPPQ
jgi:aquaporin Z